jgi:hypothetical protein
MLATTITALLYQGFLFFSEKSYLLGGTCIILILLAAVIVYDARHILFKLKNRES